EQVGDGVLAGKQSALYPVLRNLEAAGVLESFVEPSDAGPPRRYYRITALWRDVLRAWSGAWRATRDSVDSVLQADTPSPPSIRARSPAPSPSTSHSCARHWPAPPRRWGSTRPTTPRNTCARNSPSSPGAPRRK